DQSIDVEAVVNTKDQLSSAVLTPVSELLTFSGTGTIDEPVWKPKHISNLGKVPAQMITELTNVPVEGLKMLGQGLLGKQNKDSEASANESGGGQEIGGERAGSEKGGRNRLFPLLPNRGRKSSSSGN
ncbi:MAG: hypothetical protein AAGC68_15860, partial [Verrucomicrobiota bacterium]